MRIMNKIYYLVMSMTVILLAACSQDEMEQVKEGTLPELRVMVNHPSSITTRATISDLTTTFEAGDQIGLFAFDEGSDELIYVNVPYTYNGRTWEVSNPSQKVYFSENFKYFAYYPYQEKIEDEYYSFEDDDTAYWYYTLYYYTEDASEFFDYLISKWEPQLDQSTLESYNASDLMVGKGTKNNENASVSFTLEHQMGLVRIAYYDGQNQEYVEDISFLDSKECFYNEYEEDCPIPYNTGKDFFHYIAKPGTDLVFWYMDPMTGARYYDIEVDDDKGFVTDFEVSPSY